MQGPHNRAVPCPLCHEKFFPKSLPFHVKQCEKRLAAQRVNCPYCQVEVSGLQLPSHVSQCPRAKRPGQGRGGQGGGGSGGGGGQRGGAGPNGGRMEEERPMEAGQFDPEVLEDGRMRCVHCGRYFNSDRIDKHQSICGKLKSARPKGVDGQPTQTEAKVFDATAQRTGKGTAFCSPEQYKRRQEQRMREIERGKANKTQSDWRRQHAEFQAACKAGRGDPAAATMPPMPKTGMVTCPHCSRQFDRVAAERHIPICAKVVNRPKPPPSPSRALPSPPGHGAPPQPAPYGSTWHGGSPGQSRSNTRPTASSRVDDTYEQPPESTRGGRLPPSGASTPQRAPPGRRAGAGGTPERGTRGMASSTNSLKPPSNTGSGWNPSASEGTLPRIPPGGGRRGLAASAESLRPPSQDGAGGGGGRRNLAASADGFRQPPDGRWLPQGAEGPKLGSAGSLSSASSGGAGLHAARSLRGQQRRPSADSSPLARRPPQRPARVEEVGPPDDLDSDSDIATMRPDLDVTTKQLDLTTKADEEEDSRPHARDLSGTPRNDADARPAATQRMGLRRSALLYRLLSQVPREALARELDCCGVDTGSLDEEGMIEAIAEQLS